MAATAWTVYDSFLLEKNNGTQDLDSHVFRAILMTASYTPDTASDSTYTGILANEVANGLGYTTAGELVTTSLDATVDGEVTLDGTSVSWLADTGDLVFQYAVVYNVNTDGLVGYTMLDPAALTLIDTYTLFLDILSSGIFTESRV